MPAVFLLYSVPDIYCQCESRCQTQRESDGQFTATCSDSTCPRFGKWYVINVTKNPVLLEEYVPVETNGAGV